MVSRALRRKENNLTTHDVVQLYVFKGWNFSLEFKRRAVAQENSLNERKWNKAVDVFGSYGCEFLFVFRDIIFWTSSGLNGK